MHPIAGPALLALLLFLVFQAVFSWAQAPVAWINAGMNAYVRGEAVQNGLPAGPLRSLIVDGVIAGAGSVLVFLPQIVILFFFILLLEDSGYLPRGAFLLDRLMGGVGLSGRSFHPAAVIVFLCDPRNHVATRTIPKHLREIRMATILLAPMMTCSARLPVVRADHRRLHPDAFGRALQSSRPGAVRTLRSRSAGRAAGGTSNEAFHHALELSPSTDGVARVPLAECAQFDHPGCGSARGFSSTASAPSFWR